MMKFFKPSTLEELFQILEQASGNIYYLAGGSDINIEIKKNIIKNDDTIIYIGNLDDLKGISYENEKIIIGAASTFSEIIDSDLLREKMPGFTASLKNFASPLIQPAATIGGNIANGSPTADVLPLLLILNAELELVDKNEQRKVKCPDFYYGYKKNVLKQNEILKCIEIPVQNSSGFKFLYKKIGSRNSLTIAKLSVAALIRKSGTTITELKIAAGALNEFPRRLSNLENHLTGMDSNKISSDMIAELLRKEITPISDLRSDKEYRFRVCLNLIENFVMEK